MQHRPQRAEGSPRRFEARGIVADVRNTRANRRPHRAWLVRAGRVPAPTHPSGLLETEIRCLGVPEQSPLSLHRVHLQSAYCTLISSLTGLPSLGSQFPQTNVQTIFSILSLCSCPPPHPQVPAGFLTHLRVHRSICDMPLALHLL